MIDSDTFSPFHGTYQKNIAGADKNNDMADRLQRKQEISSERQRPQLTAKRTAKRTGLVCRTRVSIRQLLRIYTLQCSTLAKRPGLTAFSAQHVEQFLNNVAH